MNKIGTGEYTDWRCIDYQPATQFLPDTLVSHISRGQTALDIGCGAGDVSLFLADQGMDVLGIDINEKAIEIANRRVANMLFELATRFRVADFLEDHDFGCFDVVLMNRL